MLPAAAVGREPQITAVLDGLRAARVVTLTGPGGCAGHLLFTFIPLGATVWTHWSGYTFGAGAPT